MAEHDPALWPDNEASECRSATAIRQGKTPSMSLSTAEFPIPNVKVGNEYSGRSGESPPLCCFPSISAASARGPVAFVDGQAES